MKAIMKVVSNDLPEAELLQNLISYSPDARRRHVAFDADVDPRP
jgi:hypothetical protein